MCKVSVIMPSYNVVRYIRECLESVVNQTLRDIEILCIDAGSTDGTREIITEFADKDPRIQLIDSEKKSCGYQENRGIAVARGEYIGFVETDDYIKEDMFELLYNAAKKDNLDYVKSNYISFVNIDEQHRLFGKSQIMYQPEVEGLYNVVFNPSLYPEVLQYDNSMWNGIYKTQFLREKKVFLNETPGAAYQDMGFEIQVMCRAERAIYIEDALYYYRKDNENCSMKDSRGLEKVFAEFLFVKGILLNNPDTMRWHWWIYYSKFCGSSIRDRVGELLQQDGKLSEKMDNILDRIREEYIWGMERGYILPNRIKYPRMTEVTMLIKDKRSYLQYLYYEMQVKLYAQQEIIEKARQWEEVIIFGAGLCGQRLFALLSKNGVNCVKAFCDNSQEKQGCQLFGKAVLNLEDSMQLYPNAFYIIANEFHYMSISRQLLKACVNRNRIAYYLLTRIEL